MKEQHGATTLSESQHRFKTDVSLILGKQRRERQWFWRVSEPVFASGVCLHGSLRLGRCLTSIVNKTPAKPSFTSVKMLKSRGLFYAWLKRFLLWPTKAYYYWGRVHEAL